MELRRSGRTFELGRVSFVFDGIDLRYLRVDDHEIVRRIFVTVREADWEVPALAAVEASIQESESSIEITVDGSHRSDAVEVDWTMVVVVREDGVCSCSVVSRPLRQFSFQRLGLCLLHPPGALCGGEYSATTPKGRIDGRFDELVSPQRIVGPEIFPLFPAFSELKTESRDGHGAGFVFRGDLFEMEDQRNWSDNSFKTYCPPLSEPSPRVAEVGRFVRQDVELRPDLPAVRRPSRTRVRSDREAAVSLRVDSSPSGLVVPGVGLVMGPDPKAALPSLTGLNLEHVRIELRDPARASLQLQLGAQLAHGLGSSLYPAIYSTERDYLERVLPLLKPYERWIRRLLIFDGLSTSSGAHVASVRGSLEDGPESLSLIGGTDGWFAELNRNRPSPGDMDGVAWSITPQVHADDDLSIVETIEPQGDQVRTAHSFAPGLDLVVGPITLRPRYQPHAADAWSQSLDPRPEAADPRQGALLAAAWTAASLAELSSAGTTSLTYFETDGPRGIVGGSEGGVRPCWHPLAEFAAWRGWDVLQTESEDPMAVRALSVLDPRTGEKWLIAANLRSVPTTLRLEGLGPELRARFLDSSSMAAACADPISFRARPGRALAVADPGRLTLAPYGVVTVRELLPA